MKVRKGLHVGAWYCPPLQGVRAGKEYMKTIIASEPDIFNFFVYEFSYKLFINCFTYTALCNRMDYE
jgi:hypothetical protein